MTFKKIYQHNKSMKLKIKFYWLIIQLNHCDKEYFQMKKKLIAIKLII